MPTFPRNGRSTVKRIGRRRFLRDAGAGVLALGLPRLGLVALCDVDQNILHRQAAELKDQGQPVAAYGDPRRLLDDKSVDAVLVATPNHWHALATIWACQAGKDVYVEKPVSHNIWEGRQMVTAARKYGRIVQGGTQARSSSVVREAFDWVQRGELGPIRFARVILYRQRSSIGKVSEPTPIIDVRLETRALCR